MPDGDLRVSSYIAVPLALAGIWAVIILGNYSQAEAPVRLAVKIGRPEFRRHLADLQATAGAAERGRLASNEAGLGSCGIVSL